MLNLLSLLFLLFIGLVLWPWLRGWKKAAWLSAVWTALFLLVGLGPIARWLTTSLQKSEYYRFDIPNPGHHLIILLGAGNAVQDGIAVLPTVFGHSRIEATATAFHRIVASGSTCDIIVSGGDPHASGKTEAAVYVERLAGLGIPRDRIQLEGRSRNTYQNAEYTAELLRPLKYDRIFLVTSGLHMQRSLLYFANFELKTTPIAADLVSAPISALPLGFNFALADLAFHEYVGMARLHVYNQLGWNKQNQASSK